MLGLAHTQWRSHYRDWRVRRLTRWRVRILLDGVGVGVGVRAFVVPIGVVLVLVVMLARSSFDLLAFRSLLHLMASALALACSLFDSLAFHAGDGVFAGWPVGARTGVGTFVVVLNAGVVVCSSCLLALGRSCWHWRWHWRVRCCA